MSDKESKDSKWLSDKLNNIYDEIKKIQKEIKILRKDENKFFHEGLYIGIMTGFLLSLIANLFVTVYYDLLNPRPIAKYYMMTFLISSTALLLWVLWRKSKESRN